MTVAQFWTKYLHYCEHEWKGRGMKPSTIRGFKQIWRQFLEGHFGEVTVQEYTSDHARRLLSSLKTTQVKSTLKQIRSVVGGHVQGSRGAQIQDSREPLARQDP